MRNPYPVAAATATALLAFSLWAPAADATSPLYNRVLHIYEATTSIPPCEFTSAQLESVLKSSDTYEQQYFADFTNAINGALEERGTGACARKTAQPAATGAGSANAGPPLRLGPVTAATGSGVPAPIFLLAALGALLTLIGAAAWLTRLRGWDPGWAAAWGHAWDEAEYRVRGRYLDVRDRMRSRE